MGDYLNPQYDYQSEEFVNFSDEVSLWSAMFGQVLLDRMPMQPNQTVLDFGCGAGFPTIEIAQRLGDSCQVYGIDIWSAALIRAQQRKAWFNLQNVQFIEGDIGASPFENEMFDLLVSNLGVNNFENPVKVFHECARIARPGARLILTTNPNTHMHEFYTIYERTLSEMNRDHLLPRLRQHVAHRLNGEQLLHLLGDAGFSIIQIDHQTQCMRFLNGSTFLRHAFIRTGFMDGWKNVLPQDDQVGIFQQLEANINQQAQIHGEFQVTIPILYLEAERT